MERISVLCRTTFTPLFDFTLQQWKEDQRSPRDAAALVQLFYQFAKDVNGGNVIRVEFDRSSIDSSSFSASNTSTTATGSRPIFNHPIGLSHRGIAMQPFQTRQSVMVRKRGPTNPTQTQQQPQPASSFPFAAAGTAMPTFPSALSPTSSLSPPSHSSSAPPASSKSIQMYCADNAQIIVAVFVNQDYDKNGATVAVDLRDSFMREFPSELVEYERVRLPASEASLSIETFLPTFSAFQQTIDRSGCARITATQHAAIAVAASPVSATSSNNLPSSLPSANRPTVTTIASAPNTSNGRPVGSLPDPSYFLHHADDYMPSWLQDSAGDAPAMPLVQLSTVTHTNQQSPDEPATTSTFVPSPSPPTASAASNEASSTQQVRLQLS